jgi:hypothetical protein
MAGSLKTAGRLTRPLGKACHASLRSSQTHNEPRRSSKALYAGQIVVQYLARTGLLISSTYQDRVWAEAWARTYATTPPNTLLEQGMQFKFEHVSHQT